MKPGRELDVLVAEKINGLKPFGPIDYQIPLTSKIIEREAFLAMTPRYSTDIAAAWELMEKINSSKNKWTLNSLRCDPNDGKWQFGDIDRDGSIWPDDKYDSAPHAICLAALKAVGEKI